MVAFHDRRTTRVGAVDDLLSELDLQPGDTVGKQVIGERFAVVGRKTENGRKFEIHEALPNGRVIKRGDAFDRRYQAKHDAEGLTPTSVYNI